ncbi:MAG: lipid-transfer protein [Deltaproteobacteria bacterium]|nr:lipid-transfer protein [Deltaproteobacteria bacterium]
MSTKVNVIGVGMVEFGKPGKSDPYNVMAGNATREALADAGVEYGDVQQAVVGYVFGESTCGQRALYEVGLTGIPIFNVNNNCATGSSALMLGSQAIKSGAVDCVLVVGFEQMKKGALASIWDDRTNPMDKHVGLMNDVQGFSSGPITAQLFGGAAREYRWRYGTKRETFAKISWKARKHAVNDPHAVFREPLSVEEVLASPEVFEPLTRFQCCPPTCGAAAAVLCSDDFAKRKKIQKPVYIAGQVMATDLQTTFEPQSMIKMIGYDMAKHAADQLYEMTGVGPKDVDVAELHDCFTANELLTYEAIGLCEEGGAEKFIEEEDNTYGGRVVTNPSGGLLSKGHPLGATGVAQCAELVWQLRGEADKRQVEGAKIALQHNLGLGGACVMTMYRRD